MTDTPDRREPVASARRADDATDPRVDPATGRAVDPDQRTVAIDRDSYPDRTVDSDGDGRRDRYPDDRTPDDELQLVGALAPRDVVARERERFGGLKFGSAFFGWLTAMGLVVLLSAFVAAIGGAINLTSPGTVEDAADAATENFGVATVVGAIVIGLVLFIGYFAGGYVAGRMARFSGLLQGLGVWLWAILVAVIVGVISAIAGTQWDILATLDSFPRIPLTPETLTLTGILTAIGAAIVALVGALLGGVAGMRYHRRVDRVGLGLES